MQRIEMAGVALDLDEAGSGPPVLYLHAEHYLDRARLFLDRLASGRRVLAPTHPGFAGRPPPPDFRTVEDLAYLYLDLLDRLGLEDVLLVGASLGGWIATEMCVRDTGRIGRLALIAPTGVKFGGREDRAFTDLFALGEDEIRRCLFFDPERFAPDYATASDAEMEAIARERQWAAYYGWRPYMHNPRLARWLHRVRVPALLLWGERDGYVPRVHGEALARALPDARLEVIGRAGHYPQIERAEETAQAIERFAAGAAEARSRQGAAR